MFGEKRARLPSMKGAGFRFSLSSQKGRKKTTKNWPRALSEGILFYSPATDAVGELSFHCFTKSAHNTLFTSITFSHCQLLMWAHWACPQSLRSSWFSSVEALPGFCNYSVLQHPQTSTVFLQNQSPSMERKHQTYQWKRESLPHPTAPLCCLTWALCSFKILPDSSTQIQPPWSPAVKLV